MMCKHGRKKMIDEMQGRKKFGKKILSITFILYLEGTSTFPMHMIPMLLSVLLNKTLSFKRGNAIAFDQLLWW
jgi:hypothetical protein